MQSESTLRVLVADDEWPIRQELRSYEWRKFGADLIGEAENGEEALRMCREYVPDVVITDITMPVMSGIELLRCLRAEMPSVQVILLTCHTEFDYAKEALKEGAVDYLLKVTLETEELQAALEKARSRIQSALLTRSGELSARRKTLARALAQLGAGQTGAGVALSEYLPARLVMIRVEAYPEAKAHAVQELHAALEQLANGDSFPMIWAQVETQFVFLQDAAAGDAKRIESRLLALLRTLKLELAQSMSVIDGEVHVYGLISETVYDVVHIPGILAGAKRWAAVHFYESNPDATPVYIGRPQAEASLVDEQEAAAFAQSLHRIAKSSGEDAAANESFAALCMRKRYDPEQLKRLAYSFIRTYGNAPSDPLFRSLSFREWLENLLMLFRRTGLPDKRQHKEIADAVAYISANPAADLSLAAVSARVGLSPRYFSKLFREQTGEAYVDYVTGKRIEKAVELLRDTHLKVYEVAERVGISSYRYFTAVFREKTGLTPTDVKRG